MNNKKIALILLGAIIIMGAVGAYGVLTMQDYIFEQIPYTYTTYVSLPPDSPEGGSLGGYLNINGQGSNFNFDVAIPGAAKAYENRTDEGFLTYTEEGLNGTGKIESIDISLSTISGLIGGNFKELMVNTPLKGTLNMTCAGWDGNASFINEGAGLEGVFVINGVHTYWAGNFTMEIVDGRIALPAEYIWHPQGNPSKTTRVNKTFYLS